MNKNELRKGSATLWIIILVVVAAAIGGGAYYFTNPTTPTPAGEVPVTGDAAKDTKAIEDLVAKLMVLPQGEEPVLATVTDAEKLRKEQAFYANVENGDKVLIYPKSQKAIIYSTTMNKIVNVGPIIAAPQQNTQTGTPAAGAPVVPPKKQ